MIRERIQDLLAGEKTKGMGRVPYHDFDLFTKDMFKFLAEMYEEGILRVDSVIMEQSPDDESLPHIAVDMQNPEMMEYSKTQEALKKYKLDYDRYDYHTYWFFRDEWYKYYED